MASIKEFKREYVKAIQEGYAAVFAGAGLSRPSGYVDWKTLLREIASDINLDIDKEQDLVAVAQYYCNEKQGRSSLNNTLYNSFVLGSSENNNINLLAEMPIDTYWTTNYDHLLEDIIRKRDKIVDVKVNPKSLATTLEEKDVIIYKMHGDYTDPASCVLTKDDYESYNIERQLFTTSLQGELISKTFLFIGFSFDDPNLNYILSRIRVLLNENQRPHYCLLKTISRKNYKSKKDYEYDLIKQNLRVKDLLRYSIHAVMVNEFNGITDILKDVKRSSKNNHIFISGSAHDYGENWSNLAIPFIRALTQRLCRENLKIVTGHARGLGSYIISAVLDEIHTKRKKLDKCLDIKAFPYQDKERNDYKELISKYRQDIFKQCGIAIFMFGNKLDNESVVKSQGVYEEFLIAQQNGCYIIPIGSTGFVAQDIFNVIKENINNYTYLLPYLTILEFSTDPEKIIATIMKIISDIRETF